ncbi:MAG TPA: DUF4159 domain-containing protein [Vicinamibacterales bacterium]|nr:DUF4159 domain-containing protein [Vicinamibacterales bacterium]
MKARAVVLAVVLIAVVASLGFAQRGRGGRGGRGLYSGRPARYATLDDFKGGFQFCRVVFRQGNGDGAGWNVDWPRADINLSIRLSELTRTPVTMDATSEPETLLISLKSPELFHCPFIMLSEPGGAYLDDQEAKNLRDYLLKGGFLWADDYWGDYAWDYWESMLRKVLPSASYPLVDISRDHPIFHQVLNAQEVPQIPGIGYWDGANRTWERPGTEHDRFVAINDAKGRIMVLMTFNTDFGDSYERETENPLYFQKFSVPGYAFGINTIIYSLTH